MRQSACLVIKPFTFDNFATLFLVQTHTRYKLNCLFYILAVSNKETKDQNKSFRENGLIFRANQIHVRSCENGMIIRANGIRSRETASSN